jgi:stage IV sporulation protein FB
MLQEPGSSQYDLQFSFLGFPVRITWGFWVVAAVLGWSWSVSLDDGSQAMGLDTPGAPMLLVIWTAALLLSILVHELGHALAMRMYGMRSRIVLYHFGGLAISDSFGAWDGARQRRVGPREQIVISIAGPAMQLGLALVVWLIGLQLQVPMNINDWLGRWLGIELGAQELGSSIVLYALLDAILFPSTAWAILNLAPILPLDGGQIMRSGLMLSRVADPMRIAHTVSIGAGALLGLYFIQSGEPFGVMFLLLAANNWQSMQYGSRGF